MSESVKLKAALANTREKLKEIRKMCYHTEPYISSLSDPERLVDDSGFLVIPNKIFMLIERDIEDFEGFLRQQLTEAEKRSKEWSQLSYVEGRRDVLRLLLGEDKEEE